MADFTYTFGATTYNLSSRTFVMGILNVTPDSFFDGGRYLDADAAVDRALAMIDEGADFIDVGGESTRPRGAAYGEGAEAVEEEEERNRVVPVIAALAKRTRVPISVDTYKSSVAAHALDAGATLVNDISGFTFDEKMPETVASRNASVILMHIKGTPRTMQMNPRYDDLIGEIASFLERSAARAKQQGVGQIILDPGIGFGKTVEHNLTLLNRLADFSTLGYPILVGASRKSFIGQILNESADQRLEGSVAAAVAAAARGANIVRVHDVRATKRALRIADAIMTPGAY